MNNKDLKITYVNDYRTRYDYEKENKRGEHLNFEIEKAYYYNNKYSNSLPNLWVQNGYTKHLYNSCLWVECEVTDKNNNCYRRYEPTTKLSNDKKRYVINFKWMFEVSEENEEKLINEIIKRFEEAK